MRRRHLWSLRPSTLAAVAISAAACATNPATGERQLMFVSEGQEIRMGREADPEIIGQFGLTPDSGIQRYVRAIGERLAAVSERPNLPWTFRALDDASVNAFALPGGFNYVTRGIMAHLNSEAELVAVMGHEVGHVTARHSASQMSKAQLATAGLVAGMILAPDLQGVAGAASAGLGLLFLRFSRDHERQADDLGLRYMTRLDYDPREMPRVFEMLDQVSRASGAGRLPGWLSTHPDPEDRQQRLERHIGTLPRAAGALVRRDEYLRVLDGMVYGENPREGYVRGQTFIHPELEFWLDFPQGWQVQNQRQAVVAQSPRRDAIIELTLSNAPSADAGVRAFLGQEGLSGGSVRSGEINGHPETHATFRAPTPQGAVNGLVVFLSFDRNLYRLLGFATGETWRAYESVIRESIGTFDRAIDLNALQVQPLRLAIVRLDRAMTLTEFERRYPSEVPLETLALLNRVQPDERLPQGQLVKRVVGGPLP